MKRRMALVMALCMGFSGIPVYAAEQAGEAYTTVEFTEEGFVRVLNPNGGATLSYSPKSGVTLLEEEADGYTYAFKDLNRNGTLDTYEDWRLTPEERARALTDQLPVDVMAGLMIESFQVRTEENGEISDEVTKMVVDEGIRTFLIRNSGRLKDRVTWFNNLQALTEANDAWGIPSTLSTDPKNGSAGSAEDAAGSETATSGWPSSLGLAATFDSEQAFLMGQIIADEYRALGIGVALSPQIDLATEPRWSRFSGTFGENSNLVGDFSEAMVSGMQSTWNGTGTDAEDEGWGADSVIAMVKHFPGDGSAEAGRESHNNYGKYNVYPGHNLEEHLHAFERTFNLEHSITGTAAAVMPSYSIAYDEFGPIGESVGSGFSAYKLLNLLRDKLGFGGLICADWEITENKQWGLETQGYEERYVTALKNGLNQFGGLYFKYGVEDAYETGSLMLNQKENAYPSFHHHAGEVAEGVDGAAVIEDLFRESTYLVLENHFKLGLFEDAYLSWEESQQAVNNLEYAQAGFEAQKASVVMLKNKGNVVVPAAEEKKTVYIPMEINTGSVTDAIGNNTLAAHAKGDWSLIGYEELTFDGALAYSFDPALAGEYFNVVTDSLDPNADLNNLTEKDIVSRTDFTGVDFALVAVSAPKNGNGYNADLVDLDPADGTIDNGYYAISLQYGDYYADPAVVREYPIAVDPNEEIAWTEAGGERGRSRYYGGKTTVSSSLSELELILTTRETIGDLPMVVYVSASNPFCTYEFEESSDAILVGFGVSSDAALEVISGKYEPNGLLPMQMPANMETVEKQYEDVAGDMECHVDSEGNTYDFGFGMNWNGVISDSRTEQYK